MLIYTQKCKGCGHSGNMKAYEDEMERIATKFAKVLCTSLGYEYEKEEKFQRKSNPRSDHIEKLCGACKVGICPERIKRSGRAKTLTSELA